MIVATVGFMFGSGGTAIVANTYGAGEKEKANQYFQELLEIKRRYIKFLNNPKDKHCLMFVEGDFDNAEWFNLSKLEEMVESVRVKIEEVQSCTKS